MWSVAGSGRRRVSCALASSSQAADMSRAKILLVCLPLALAGVGVTVRGTVRVRAREAELGALAEQGRAAGQSFVDTLQGGYAEQQRLVFERRRAVALSLAAARRDRLLGVLLAAASGLAGVALSVMARIAREVEEDQRHVGAQGAEQGPGRS
jgi:hypothetical protein